MSTPVDTDIYLVNRGGSSFTVTQENIMAELQDTDLLLVNRANASCKITGADFKASVVPPNVAPVIASALLTENSPGGSRFGGESFTTTMTMDPEGTPLSTKYLKPYVLGAITLYGQTSSITDVTQGGWTAASATEAINWRAITYGNGKFVATSENGTNQVMWSVDGISWNSASPATNKYWDAVTYGNGKFVSVAQNSPASTQVMYSTDGITWSSASAIEGEDHIWRSVTYGDNKFVAVSSSGTNRVMYSTDGINWNPASAAEANTWYSVTYGNGKFVAVSTSGTNRVMYSADGINWNAASAASASGWRSVAYGNGKFVAVSTIDPNQVMYSSDGINWNSASVAEVNTWRSVTYGGDKFIAVSSDGTNRVMYSTDGINWSSTSATEANTWYSVTYGDGKFVAVSDTGTNQVMWSVSGTSDTTLTLTNDQDLGYFEVGDVVDDGATVTAIDASVPSISVDGGTWAVGEVVTNTVERQEVNIPTTDTITSSTTVTDSTGYEAIIYTGNGVNGRDVTGLSFSPDLVWVKGRTKMPDGYSYDHVLADTVRGVDKALASNTDDPEKTNQAYGYISQFNSDGFSVTAGSTQDYCVNETDEPYVAWCFDGGNNPPVVIPVGSLNEETYNESEDWSSYGTGGSSPGSGNELENATDGSFTTKTLCNIGVPTVWNFGSIFANATKVRFYAAWGSSNTYANILKIDSTDVGPSVSGLSYNYEWSDEITVSGFTTITSNRPQGGHLMAIVAIEVDGKVLKDDNVTISLPSIASTVKANPTDGFSIVSCQPSNGSSVGHGCEAVPDLIIFKNLASNSDWRVFHKDVGVTYGLLLNSSTGRITQDLGIKALTPTTFSVGTATTGDDYIAYCWASKPGISKISSYIGNGQSNGPVVDCGFEPGFLLVKCFATASSQNWVIFDSTRNPSNPVTDQLYPNLVDEESTATSVVNFTPTGFQIINDGGDWNASGKSYIFMALHGSSDLIELGFNSGQDLNRFSDGDNAYYGDQPSSVTGTVKSVVDSGNTHTMRISPPYAGWTTGGFVTGDAGPDPEAKMYCVTTSAGTILDITSSDPGYTQMTSTSPFQPLTFAVQFPSGEPVDTELPEGTAFAVDCKADNSQGESLKTTNVVTPT